ncbi:hypothetical protein LEM8419_02457 [Neolewinella maritima]|uniref:DoxX family protein n=1 Tax=Neolewinella maritima TaxID=1383882 RepID=A0ABM9B2H6_9BACT|nr:hypothetical protein [Neolewinella maritima]CAH1001554.1 hypothetical protein LEM8419_02457 [Neolewinella maritima]
MTKERIGLILLGLVGLALLGSGIMKFTQPAEMVEAMGVGPLLTLAVVELLIVTALLIPRTRLLGIILAANYIGGIIAFSWLVEQETPIVGIALNTLLYVGAALYRPWLTDNQAGRIA